MSTLDYKGLYGWGRKDEMGTIYLPIDERLEISRSTNPKGTFDVIVYDAFPDTDDKGHPLSPPGTCLDENITLNEWRRLYLHIRTKQGIEEMWDAVSDSCFQDLEDAWDCLETGTVMH